MSNNTNPGSAAPPTVKLSNEQLQAIRIRAMVGLIKLSNKVYGRR